MAAISEAQRSQNFHETRPAQGRPRSGRCHARHAQTSRGRRGPWMPTPFPHPTPRTSLGPRAGSSAWVRTSARAPRLRDGEGSPPSLVWVNKRMTAGAVPGPPERPALSQAAAHTAWRPMRQGSTRTHGNRGRGPRLTPGKAQQGQKSSGWTRQGAEIGRGAPVLRPPLGWTFCKELHGVDVPGGPVAKTPHSPVQSLVGN